MRRNNRLSYMNYQERQAYRANRSTQIANEKQAVQDTITRLGEAVTAIEDAFKPEAEKLHASIIAQWNRAFKFVLAHVVDFKLSYEERLNNVRTAKVGRDFIKDPIPGFKGEKYVNRMGYGRLTDEYAQYQDRIAPSLRMRNSFVETDEYTLLTHLIDTQVKLDKWALKNANELVEANKFKLLNGVGEYLMNFQSVKVVSKNSVKAYAKGFQGLFHLVTDKGNFTFDCKAIVAEGPIVSAHWRYIIHVKEGHRAK